MKVARLRIVGKKEKNKFEVEAPHIIRDLKLYYFPLEIAAHNLDVPERWILQNLSRLTDRKRFDGTWYFSPDDYHKLRELRDG